jgi:hypothetical protein
LCVYKPCPLWQSETIPPHRITNRDLPFIRCTNQAVPTRKILGIHPPLSSLDGRGRPALSQNPKLRRRASPGVRRGHRAGRPGTTRRLLSALRGVLLPFAHGFRRLASSGSDGVCWKVGRPRALVACLDITNRSDNICPFIGLGSKRFAEVPRASTLSSFQPLRAGHACHSHAFAY